jgi:hypothetical protein
MSEQPTTNLDKEYRNVQQHAFKIDVPIWVKPDEKSVYIGKISLDKRDNMMNNSSIPKDEDLKPVDGSTIASELTTMFKSQSFDTKDKKYLTYLGLLLQKPDEPGVFQGIRNSVQYNNIITPENLTKNAIDALEKSIKDIDVIEKDMNEVTTIIEKKKKKYQSH